MYSEELVIQARTRDVENHPRCPISDTPLSRKKEKGTSGWPTRPRETTDEMRGIRRLAARLSDLHETKVHGSGDLVAVRQGQRKGAPAGAVLHDVQQVIHVCDSIQQRHA